jgi:indolepyruvate ferredoxin oxidoreductase
MSLAEIRLDDKYRLATGHLYLTGTQALTRLPMLQHQRDQAQNLNTGCFISGYRGSPLGGLDKSLWEARDYLKQHAIHFQPGLNEELAATAVWGSQQTNLFPGAKYDGVFAMWYGKGPGVDRSGDVFKHGNAAGVSPHGGVLLLAGDDHGCKSSTLPHQSEHAFIAASIPVLNPANVQEILDYGIIGWELSRYSGCWVALKTIAENVDSSAVVEVDPLRVQTRIPDDFELPEDGVHIRWPDPPLAQEKRLNLYKIYRARLCSRQQPQPGDARFAEPAPGHHHHRQELPRRAPGTGRSRIGRGAVRASRPAGAQGRHELAAGAGLGPRVRPGSGRDSGGRGKTQHP